jgi:hypothetical protein
MTFPARRLLAAVPVILLALAGCTNHVSGGGEGGGGAGAGGDGAGGGGGQPACKTYTGAGCTPGETTPCSVPDPSGQGTLTGVNTCTVVSGCETAWNYGCNTPLVLSRDGAPVEYLVDRAHGFDVNGGQSFVTDWPTARTPWLAIDRDGDGRIADGSELFGSMSPLAGGGRAENGFAALRALDDDGDGRITAADPSFARLLVWVDDNGNRRSDPGELVPAAAWGLVSIDLGYTIAPRCDGRSNCEVERAAFRFRDGDGSVREGAVIDVHLAPQQ